MGKSRPATGLRSVRGLLLLILFGIVVPGAVLGFLSLSGLERDRLAQEKLLEEKHASAAMQIVVRIEKGVEAIVDPVRKALMGLELLGEEGIAALESRLLAIRDELPAVQRFFIVSGETWGLLSPAAPAPVVPRGGGRPTRSDILQADRTDDPRERVEGLVDIYLDLTTRREEHDVLRLEDQVEQLLLAAFENDREGRLEDIAARFHARNFHLRYTSEICDRIRRSHEETDLGPIPWETVAGGGPPLLYGTVALEGASPPFYLGFVIDLDVIRREVLPAIVLGIERGGMRVSIDDQDGVRIGGGDPGDFHATDLSLGGGLPRWTVHVAGDPESFGRRYLRRRATLLGLVTFLAAALFAGAGLTIRGVSREMQAAHLKSDFVASVSHELRTPLTSIRMFSEMIRSGRARTPEKQKEYADLIFRESDRLEALIDNVLDFSRLEQGVGSAERSTQPIGNIVLRTVERFREHILTDDFTMEVSVDEELPSLYVDPEGLGRALVNLLGNAMKFAQAEKWIAVRAYRDGEEVRIEVRDRGPGIPARERERIFDKFYRGEDVRVAGCGLGLAIVRAILEAHDGEIRVESTPGEGSVFTMVLPAPRIGEGERRTPGPTEPAPV